MRAALLTAWGRAQRFWRDVMPDIFWVGLLRRQRARIRQLEATYEGRVLHFTTTLDIEELNKALVGVRPDIRVDTFPIVRKIQILVHGDRPILPQQEHSIKGIYEQYLELRTVRSVL